MLQETFLIQTQRINPGKLNHVRGKHLSKSPIHTLPHIGGGMEAWEYLHGLRMVDLRSIPIF
jgi:type I restriction enzyme R subunit